MADYTLDRALSFACLRFGARHHIVDGEKRFSFCDLEATTSRLADELHEAGVSRGARVALRIANGFESIAAAFAVWRAGAVLVPLNPRLGPEDEGAICEHSGAVARAEIDGGQLEIERFPASDGSDDGADSDLAAIAFTSGTTGRAKGVEITHAGMLWSATAVSGRRRDTDAAVAAVVSPLCHLPVFVSHYLARLLSGGTVVVGAFRPDGLVAMLSEEGITDLPLVPAMVAPLLERITSREGERLRLRKVSIGSAVTPMETKHVLAERFPRAEILEAYGQTETTDGVTMTVGRESLERPGTVGRAHPILAVAVMEPGGRSLLPPEEPGELVCQGPTVMRRYFRDPEATARAFQDGWLRTGDLGRMDEDGYVFVTGRLKEIIITGGENVSPEEIEAVLRRHRAVADAGVFGVPDARWGEAITAAVIATERVAEAELAEHVGASLAHFKKPKRIVFVDELPKTHAGKIRRAELRERYTNAAIADPETRAKEE